MTRRLIPAFIASLFCLIATTGFSKADPEPTTRPTTQSSTRGGGQNQGRHGQQRGDGLGRGPGRGPGPQFGGGPGGRFGGQNFGRGQFGQFRGPGGDNGAAGDDGQFPPRRGDMRGRDESDGVNQQTIAKLEEQIARLSAQLDRVQKQLDEREGRQDGRGQIQQQGRRQRRFGGNMNGDMQPPPRNSQGAGYGPPPMRRFQQQRGMNPQRGFGQQEDGFGRFQNNGRGAQRQFGAWQHGQPHEGGRKWTTPYQQDGNGNGHGRFGDWGHGAGFGPMNRRQLRRFGSMYGDRQRGSGSMHEGNRRLGPPPFPPRFMDRFGPAQNDGGRDNDNGWRSPRYAPPMDGYQQPQERGERRMGPPQMRPQIGRGWQRQWQSDDRFNGDERNQAPQRRQENRSWNDNRDGGPSADFSGPPRWRGPAQRNQRGGGDSQDEGAGAQGGQPQRQ